MQYIKIINRIWRRKNSDYIKIIQKIRLMKLKNMKNITKIIKPYRLDKARQLGYRKSGKYLIYRIKIRRNKNKKKAIKGKVFGKTKARGINKKKLSLNLKKIAQHKLLNKISNVRIINIYWINQDTKYKYFEAILEKRGKK